MLIKTKVTTTQEIEKEIELPYFAKDDNSYLAVFNENFVIKVYDGNTLSNIQNGNQMWFESEIVKYEECPRDEFYKAYNSVFERVTLLSNVPMLAVYDQNLQATIID